MYVCIYGCVYVHVCVCVCVYLLVEMPLRGGMWNSTGQCTPHICVFPVITVVIRTAKI